MPTYPRGTKLAAQLGETLHVGCSQHHDPQRGHGASHRYGGARRTPAFAEHAISAVPVCDDNGALLGMVSEGDLMRPFVDTSVKRRAWWLTLLADGNDLAPEFLEYVRLDRHQVGDLMTKPVITATESAQRHRTR